MDNALWINHVRSEQRNKLSPFFLLNELHSFIHKNKNNAHDRIMKEDGHLLFLFYENVNGNSYPYEEATRDLVEYGGWWREESIFCSRKRNQHKWSDKGS